MRADEQNLNPAPRGRLEKAHESNIGILPAIVIFVVGFFPLRQVLGVWPAIAIVFLLGIASMRIIGLLVAPSIRLRTALDAEQGLFECQLRETDSKSYKGRWGAGYVKADPGHLVFQLKTGWIGPLSGPVDTYSEVRIVGLPVRAPLTVRPGGRAITLSTDKGKVELVAAPTSIDLLAARLMGDGE